LLFDVLFHILFIFFELWPQKSIVFSGHKSNVVKQRS
jgi:hypothetical protein